MQCAHCGVEHTKKFGKDRHGTQRYRCQECKKTFLEPQVKPIGDMRLELDKAVFALKLLLEGMSIRATERMTRIHRDTILGLVALIGHRCRRFSEARLNQVPVNNVQCDEVWGFVGMKEKTRQLLHRGEEFGDAYTYVAIERETKLVVSWYLGKRSSPDTWHFVSKLYCATSGRFQVSTDGYLPYQQAIPLTFRFNVDFAQLIKTYGSGPEEHKRYSPAKIIGAKKTRGCGSPQEDQICTSHVERQNLTIRMQMRRMTRLTNAHSKKWANHEAMLGLYFAWYNWCRPHMALKGKTPALAQGITDHKWTMEELLIAVA